MWVVEAYFRHRNSKRPVIGKQPEHVDRFEVRDEDEAARLALNLVESRGARYATFWRKES